MTDIVERLRDYDRELTVKERSKFAAEIEHLRGLLREARAEFNPCDDPLCEHCDDRERDFRDRIDAALSVDRASESP